VLFFSLFLIIFGHFSVASPSERGLIVLFFGHFFVIFADILRFKTGIKQAYFPNIFPKI